MKSRRTIIALILLTAAFFAWWLARPGAAPSTRGEQVIAGEPAKPSHTPPTSARKPLGPQATTPPPAPAASMSARHAAAKAVLAQSRQLEPLVNVRTRTARQPDGSMKSIPPRSGPIATAPAPITEPANPYAGMEIVDGGGQATDARGVLHRAFVVRDPSSKYPLTRVAEQLMIDPATSQPKVFKRSAMAAGHVVVTLQPGVSPVLFENALPTLGLRVQRRLPGSDTYLVAQSEVAPTADSVPDLILALEREAALVAAAEPDGIVTILATPNDLIYPASATYKGGLWGLNNTGQSDFKDQVGVADADIDAPEAWDISTGSSSVAVAVIDTGIDYNHPDLVGNVWTNTGEIPGNGIDDDNNGYIDDIHGWDFANNDNDPMDDHGHGTHCSGTIGGRGNNSTGVVGVCWQVKIAGLKFLSAGGQGFDSDALEALQYATNMGFRLTSNSWGGGPGRYSFLLALDEAAADGRFFVAAAGNDASDNDATPVYPASYMHWTDNVIAVAATTNRDELASFSCYGVESVHLGAPGNYIWSSLSAVNTLDDPSGYACWRGTSMATPHVSGALALAMGAFPAADFATLRGVLLGSVDPLAALDGKTTTGGRLNAHNMLVALREGLLLPGDSALDDDASGGTSGNDDGLANAGETLDLLIPVSNAGSQTLTGVTGTLSGSDTYVSIVTPSVAYGTAAPFSTLPAPSAFRIAIAPSCPANHTANLTLTFAADGGKSWSHTFRVTVYESFAITGRVTLDGAGYGGAIVLAESDTASFTRATRADGTYTLGVPAGNYTVTLDRSDIVNATKHTVTVGPAASNKNFTLTTATLSGNVTDATTGLGIPGASVFLQGDFDALVLTNSTGAYSITRLIGATTKVSVQARKRGLYLLPTVVRKTLPSGAGTLNFSLTPGYYRLTNLGTFGSDESKAMAINASGTVVGHSMRYDEFGSELPQRAFLWQNGTLTQLPIPAAQSGDTRGGYVRTDAIGINDFGQVVGNAYHTATGFNRDAYVWQSGKTARLLPYLTDVSRGTMAADINNSGLIVGDRGYSSSPNFYSGGCAWQLDANGEPGPVIDWQSIFLNTSGTNDHCHPTGVNNSGVVTGYAFKFDTNARNTKDTGFRMTAPYQWSNVKKLPMPPASAFEFSNPDGNCKTWARGRANASGVVPGNVYYINMDEGLGYDQPAVWDASNQYELVRLLGSGLIGYVLAINDANQGVGYSDTGEGSFPIGYVGLYWQNGMTFNLNELLPLNSEWTLIDAYDINNNGQIVGTAKNKDFSTYRAYLLEPVAAANAAPHAAFTTSPASGSAPLEVAFDASTSSDPNTNDYLAYAWDFGDGSTSQLVSPTHTYTEAGTFTVTLTVTDGYGLTATATATITVSETFASWIARQSGVGGQTAATADPDGDGLANLLEYALGTAPGDATSGALPVVEMDGQNHLTLTFTPQRLTGLTYTVQASSDLATWTDTALTGLTVGQPFTYTDSAGFPTAPRRFLRLRISSP